MGLPAIQSNRLGEEAKSQQKVLAVTPTDLKLFRPCASPDAIILFEEKFLDLVACLENAGHECGLND